MAQKTKAKNKERNTCFFPHRLFITILNYLFNKIFFSDYFQSGYTSFPGESKRKKTSPVLTLTTQSFPM